MQTLLTVVETCPQQSRNVFAYVAEVVQTHFAQQHYRYVPLNRRLFEVPAAFFHRKIRI